MRVIGVGLLRFALDFDCLVLEWDGSAFDLQVLRNFFVPCALSCTAEAVAVEFWTLFMTWCALARCEESSCTVFP